MILLRLPLLSYLTYPLLAFAIWGAPFAFATNGPVMVLTIANAVGPATEDYLERSLIEAQKRNSPFVILRMDTPGGLDGAMRAMIKGIIASPVPVVTYVSPSGARAASAGTYLLYASHVAAMAPGTNLGAATPVQLRGIALPGMNDKETEDIEDKTELKPGNAMERKLVNDASAYIRGLAELQGRNGQWAEKAVRLGVSLPAREALALNVIDLVAKDVDDLLRQLHGREVLVQGKTQVLNTQDVPLLELLPDWRNQLLTVITNPNAAYLLMVIGFYGLVLEFYNPGGLVAGIVGGICLLLALYSFQLLPINYAGIALILLGVSLMVAEAFQPSFGVLGVGGTVAFVFGSLILMDTQAPSFQIYLSIIVSLAVTSLLVLGGIVGLALRARNQPVVSGSEELLGKVATVVQPLDDEHVNVQVHGEIWRARIKQPVEKGHKVKVMSIDGLTLDVEELQND